MNLSKQNDDFFREKKPWSEVKDKMLGNYLSPYIQKILVTNHPILYVDGFAGKGKFDDGKDGSPRIALDIIGTCLKNTKMNGSSVEAKFIERDYSKQLTENLKDYSNNPMLNVEVVNGRYEKIINNLLQNRSNYNVFLYIDPYGIKYLDFEFLSSLSKGHFHSSELLLNLNSFGFLRVACNALKIPFRNEADLEYLEEYDTIALESNGSSINLLNIVAGENYWMDIVRGYYNQNRNFYETEELFASEYCSRLRKFYRYVLNLPIRIKLGHSPKYRMIHATNHPDGAILMAQSIYKCEELMRGIQYGAQQNLFEYPPADGVETKERFLNYLAQFKTFERLNPMLAQFFSSYGVQCSVESIMKILKNLDDTHQIVVRRTPATTSTGRSSRFWNETKGHIVEVKWNV